VMSHAVAEQTLQEFQEERLHGCPMIFDKSRMTAAGSLIFTATASLGHLISSDSLQMR
jgi:hypothetical protein